jgi:hypothetical protein
MLRTPDHEGKGDLFTHSGEKEVDLPPLHDAQQVLRPSAAMETVSSPSLGESGPLPKKVHNKGCFSPSAQYVREECHGPSL